MMVGLQPYHPECAGTHLILYDGWKLPVIVCIVELTGSRIPNDVKPPGACMRHCLDWVNLLLMPVREYLG